MLVTVKTPTAKSLSIELEPNLTVREANEAIVAALGGGLFNLQFNNSTARPSAHTTAPLPHTASPAARN